MKRIIFLLIIFWSITMNSQDNGTIYFKDGTSKNGIITIKNNNDIKFKADANSKRIIYSSDEIIRMTIINSEGEEQEYISKPVNEKSIVKNLLLTPIIEGQASLYYKVFNGYTTGYMGGGGAFSMPSSETKYYLEKKGEILEKVYPVQRFGISLDKSNKIILKLLNDCPNLNELIDRGAFEKFVVMHEGFDRENRLIEITKYYNKNCLN